MKIQGTSSSKRKSKVPKTITLKWGLFLLGFAATLLLSDFLYQRIFNPVTSDSLSSLQIKIKEKHFNKIVKKRNEAVGLGVLLASKEDYVPIELIYEGKTFKAEMRLKGDWADHLEDEKKWSYRISLKGENTIRGMKKFSIHHPKTRGYLYEMVYHKMLRKLDVLSLQYDFLTVGLNRYSDNDELLFSDKLGIYAIEEGFEKRLIERNKRREGIVLKFSEDMIWSDRALSGQVGSWWAMWNFTNTELQQIGPVETFGAKKVIGDPSLNAQFIQARNLLEAYRQKKLKTSQVFDTEKLAAFTAISNLVGATHGAFVTHNLRFYYNPITSKLEPIGFDGNSGSEIDHVGFFFNSTEDLDFMATYMKTLEAVSQEEFLNKFFEEEGETLDSISKLLKTEFNAHFNKQILIQNSNLIRKKINPSKAFEAYLLHMDEKEVIVELKSLSRFPIQLNGLFYEETKLIQETDESPKLLMPRKNIKIRFAIPDFFNNLFVQKKSQKTGFEFTKDFEKLRIQYNLIGHSQMKYDRIVPYPEFENDLVSNDIFRREGNFRSFTFLKINDKEKTVLFKSGTYNLDTNLIIPAGYEVRAYGGLKLNLRNNAKIISKSSVRFIGSFNAPIKIYSSNGTGQGLLVMNAEESQLKHVIFENLSSLREGNWSVSGAVNFYETMVKIDSCVFAKNRSEDGLNIIRSVFELKNSVFEKTQSDAFDGDFVNGRISNVIFQDPGNDAIDVSGSTIRIENVIINNAGDKGLSAGEKSNMTATNIEITNTEIAVASKDLSSIQVDNLKITNCKLGFTAFQKKPEFGVASIQVNNSNFKDVKELHLIETGSELSIDSEKQATTEDVKNKLYGAEFGKSTK